MQLIRDICLVGLYTTAERKKFGYYETKLQNIIKNERLTQKVNKLL